MIPTILYPFLQAYGMLILKDSKDPLSRISALKGVMIYSHNQQKLSSYKERILEDGEFASFTVEE